MSAKIQFKSGKTKTKVFEQVKKDLDNTDTSVLFDNKTSVLVRLAKEEPKEKTKSRLIKRLPMFFARYPNSLQCITTLNLLRCISVQKKTVTAKYTSKDCSVQKSANMKLKNTLAIPHRLF